MKVAHFGNMANDAYSIVKYLQRRRGIEADLYIHHPDFVCAYPQWEECKLTVKDIGDPFNPDLEVMNRDYFHPSWLYTLPMGQLQRHNIAKGLFKNFPKLRGKMSQFLGVLINSTLSLDKIIQRWIIVLGKMKSYDLVITHIPFSLYARFGNKPYIVFDAGAIRYFPYSSGFVQWGFYNKIRFYLMFNSYRHSKMILCTNPDTLDLFKIHSLHTIFMSFLIDTQRYKPAKVENDLPFEYVFFMPTRQWWKEKGNDKYIQAFTQFQNKHKDAVLVMTEWGDSLKESKCLVKCLGIEKNVLWVPLMSKPYLVEWYNKSTAILDQCVLGSYGTSAPEAMACEKTVLMHISKSHSLWAFGDIPPVLECQTVSDIYDKMELCTDSAFLSKRNSLSREWVEKHHSPEVVVPKHLKLYEDVLNGL